VGGALHHEVTDLTPAEHRLLTVLRENPGRTVSRDELCLRAELAPVDPLSRCVDTAIARLRHKLGPRAASLQTEHGDGYRWLAPVQTPWPDRPPALLIVGAAQVDLQRRLITTPAGSTHLTTLEARTLSRLASTPGKPVAPEDLGRRAGVAKLIYQLRRKLGAPETITSARGVGYTLHATALDDDRFTPLAWAAAALAATALDLEDVVVYRRAGAVLEQVAAWGPKRAGPGALLQPLRLPVGVGIVGASARSGQVQSCPETRADSRYVFDLHEARSELAVPIVCNGSVLGVFDCEASTPAAFTARHRRGLEALGDMLVAGV
jgi:DNA-binding response OmpR family regulator/putative methionine-R-sulfoxide reductase with GAF domain